MVRWVPIRVLPRQAPRELWRRMISGHRFDLNPQVSDPSRVSGTHRFGAGVMARLLPKHFGDAAGQDPAIGSHPATSSRCAWSCS